MSQDFSTYTGPADVSNWRGTVNGRLPSIRELLRQLPDPDGRPDLGDDTDTRCPSHLTTDPIVFTRTAQGTQGDTLSTEGSRPTAPTTSQAGSVRTARKARATTCRTLERSCGDVRLSALRYEAKGRKATHTPGMQTIYSISCPRVGGGRRVIFKIPLRMDEEDRVLRIDDVTVQAKKRQDRYHRLVRTATCARNFPDWEGAKTEEAYQQSCAKIAKELSKLVVFHFDEC